MLVKSFPTLIRFRLILADRCFIYMIFVSWHLISHKGQWPFMFRKVRMISVSNIFTTFLSLPTWLIFTEFFTFSTELWCLINFEIQIHPSLFLTFIRFLISNTCQGAATESTKLWRRRSGAAAERSNPMSKEQRLRGHRRAERSYSTFKVRRGDLIQGKEQRLCFAGAAVKRYPTSKVRETQVGW